MPTSPAQHQARIDALMEQASQHLGHRRYFDAEQACLEALRRAHVIRDYDRIARLVLPLQEARRQKRDIALDSGQVFLVSGELPDPAHLGAGCYLIAPPRVGVDGRLLREAADRSHIPVVVTVREPTTRDGLWPVVAVGPTTLRTKVAPPPAAPPPPPPAAAKSGKGKSTVTKKAPKAAPAAPEPSAVERLAGSTSMPAPKWFVETNEALGDAAIANLNPSAHPTSRVDTLIELLESHPDHEKLHQRLEEAARAAARDPRPPRRPAHPMPDEFDDDDETENGQ